MKALCKKKPQWSDQDVAWCSERVRYYIRRGHLVVYALERAVADFRRQISDASPFAPLGRSRPA
jgi:hypothetical protein